jgi:hypothetical protein
MFARSGWIRLFCDLILLPLNKNIKIILNYVIGPLVFCLLAWSIYRQLIKQINWHESLRSAIHAISGAGSWKLVLVFVLMFANWALEARKWQLAIGTIERLPFLRAWKAVFSGTTFSFFMPNRMGEYMGRILYLPEGKRVQAISLTIMCSMGQTMVTWVAGIAGLIYFSQFMPQNDQLNPSLVFWMKTVLYFTVGGAIVLTIFYFRLAWLVKWLERIRSLQKLVTYVRVLESFNATILLRILSLCITRYGVFIAQYYLLFDVFNVPLTLGQVFVSISVVFLILSIVPAIGFLTELGVRWKASIEVVQLFSNNVTGILATSFTVWIVNLVIPALIGSLLILGIKIFSNRK